MVAGSSRSDSGSGSDSEDDDDDSSGSDATAATGRSISTSGRSKRKSGDAGKRKGKKKKKERPLSAKVIADLRTKQAAYDEMLQRTQRDVHVKPGDYQVQVHVIQVQLDGVWCLFGKALSSMCCIASTPLR